MTQNKANIKAVKTKGPEYGELFRRYMKKGGFHDFQTLSERLDLNAKYLKIQTYKNSKCSIKLAMRLATLFRLNDIDSAIFLTAAMIRNHRVKNNIKTQ